jgi:hypothetical protein
VVEGYGFEFLHESWHDCTYSRCEAAMMWTTYRCVVVTSLQPSHAHTCLVLYSADRAVMFSVRKPVVLCKDCLT